RDCLAELRKTEAQIAAAKAHLDLLRAGPRPGEIGVARTAAAKAGEELKRASQVLAMTHAAWDQRLVSPKELEEAKAAVAVGMKAVDEEKGKLSVVLAGSRREEIEAAEADRARLETERGYLAEQMKLLEISSPITGIVTTPATVLKEKVGRH